jgi:hypothetical protein
MVGNEAISVRVGRQPWWRRRRFWRGAAPLIAVAGAIAAGIVALNATVGSSGSPNAPQGWGVRYPTPKAPTTVALDPRVRPLVQRFIQTAVARRNLAAAYWMAGPQVRQGMTLRQWLKGEIPVVPYPIDPTTDVQVAVDYSYARRARLEVFLVTPDRNVNSPHTFFVDLIKRHGTWYVNGWVPRWTPPIPVA